MAPHGEFGGCPVCRTALAAPAGEPIAEGDCPRCAAGLWSLTLPSGPCFFVRRPGQTSAEFIAALAGPALDVSAEEIAALLGSADWFDMIEFMHELEFVLGMDGDSRGA